VCAASGEDGSGGWSGVVEVKDAAGGATTTLRLTTNVASAVGAAAVGGAGSRCV
jgi:hypothetical protein